MKLLVSQKTLAEAVTIVQKAIPSKPQLPVLSSILLTLSDNFLTISATDLYIGIQVTIPVESKDSGEIVVPGKELRDIITSLPSDDITLSYAEGTLHISVKKMKTTLQCYVGDEYPKFPESQGSVLSMSLEVLETITTYVVSATSKDVSRPILTGVFIEPQESGTTIVGTDGFRLASVTVTDASISQIAEPLLIPAKIIEEVTRIAQKKNASNVQAAISAETQQVTFTMDSVQLFSRLIDGTFPPYQQIIPSLFSAEITLFAGELLGHIKRAMIFGRDSSSIVHLSLDKEIGTISADSPSVGTFKAELQHEKIQIEEPVTIAFNAQYLVDFLSSIKDESVWIGISDSLKPALFKIAGQENIAYVVMPFRVSSSE